MHGDRHFAADGQRGLQQQIERAVDHAFGGILDGHHAEIGGTGFGIAEHFIDGHAGQALDGMAELLVHGLFAEGAFRAQVGHHHTLFQRAASRHHFTENGLDIGAQQGAGIAVGGAAQDLRFALGTKHRGIGLGLDVAHFLRDAGALVQQVEDLRIDGIDLLAQGQQLVVTHLALSGSARRTGAMSGRRRTGHGVGLAHGHGLHCAGAAPGQMRPQPCCCSKSFR